MEKAEYIERSLFCDDRGHFENVPVAFLGSKFEARRVYVCENFETGTVRGFHYHKKEHKIFVCIKGGVKFVLLPGVNSYKDINRVEPEVFTLSAKTQNALYIPNDYANAWQSLTDDTILLGISNVTMEESVDDDIRFDPLELDGDYWDVEWR